MTAHRRRAATATLAGLLVATAAGCGAPAGDSPADAPASAATVTAAGPSGVGAVGAFARTLASVTVQAGSARYAGTVTVAGREQEVSGRLSVGDDAALLVRTDDADVGPVDLVLVGPTLYYRHPELPDPAAGRPWVRIDVAEAAPELAAVLAAVSSATSFGALAALAPVATLDGPADAAVDGQPARRYEVGVDLAAAQASNDAQVAAVAAAAAADGTSRIVTVYWLDGDGRPVEVAQQAESPAGSTAGSRLTFADWGRADPVQPPPDSDVVDGADLA